MKNQYFADVNDYRKYGLLRLLSDEGRVSTAICWMLTEDDNSTHGNNNGYASNPNQWRNYDPDLFDILKDVVFKEGEGIRKDIEVAEEHQIVRLALYYDPHNSGQRIYLTDDSEKRKEYFAEFFKLASPHKLIFFDPDNGLEVPSVPYGRRKSSKYLYRHELERAIKAGHSVLLYQHFPMHQRRDDFIARKAEELGRMACEKKIYSFRTAHVVFFLMPKDEHLDELDQGVKLIKIRWSGQIEIKGHTLRL
ncbi:MAG: hypothetical protein ACE5HI_15200 [bacterium]